MPPASQRHRRPATSARSARFGQDVAMTAPRIAPVPRDRRDELTEEPLAPMRRPDGSDLHPFATLAHPPRLLKPWSAFGGTPLYPGTPSGRHREPLLLPTPWPSRAPPHRGP